MASERSVSNFVSKIITQKGGPANPTLYNFNWSFNQAATKFLEGFDVNKTEWGADSNWDYLCNEIQIPGITFTSTDIRSYHKGKNIKVPAAKVFNEFDLSFYCDTTALPYRFFRAWMDWISGTELVADYEESKAKEQKFCSPVRFYNDCVSTCTIYKLEKMGPGAKPTTYWKPYGITLQNAYPFSMSSIPLSSASANGLVKVTVGMYYEYSKAFIPD